MGTGNSSGGSSYGQILRSSSIVGGGEAANQVIGMIRTKVVAVLIGPSGMGLVGLYVSAAGFLGVISQLGINQSGVREVAEANTSGNAEQVARVAKSLQRICWATGLAGWFMTVALAKPLSDWTFGSAEHSVAIGILGCTILLSSLTGGRTAVVNGLRRVGDLARMQVASAVVTTVLAVGIYGVLREDGIIPVIVVTGIVQFLAARYYCSKISLVTVRQDWVQTWRHARKLIGLGVALMYTGVLVNVTGLATRALIVRELDVSAAGLYQAAWTLSVMLATFVLGAMGRDFFPRLTECFGDDVRMTTLVNEQVEVGALLTLPGVVGIMIFSQILIQVLYSAEFIPAHSMLPWLLVGVFARSLSWPLGYILLAKSMGSLYSLSATLFLASQLVLTIVLLPLYGLTGVAIAFALAETIQCVLYWVLARRASGFRISASVVSVFVVSLVFILLAAGIAATANPWLTWVGGVLISLAAAVYSGRSLCTRIGTDNSIVRRLARLPLAKLLLGIRVAP